MTLAFDPAASSLRVVATLVGPRGSTTARLAVDTGASVTLVTPGLASYLGCTPAGGSHRTIHTAGGTVEAPLVRLDNVIALDCDTAGLEAVVSPLPEDARLDGLLGLDFFRGRRLIIDFRRGEMTLD